MGQADQVRCGAPCLLVEIILHDGHGVIGAFNSALLRFNLDGAENLMGHGKLGLVAWVIDYQKDFGN